MCLIIFSDNIFDFSKIWCLFHKISLDRSEINLANSTFDVNPVSVKWFENILGEYHFLFSACMHIYFCQASI